MISDWIGAFFDFVFTFLALVGAATVAIVAIKQYNRKYRDKGFRLKDL